jgi:energy-coupling factor transporter ATP-binding protein EcfA2
MRYNRFVIFTGVDGSGKTTLAKLLVTYLRKKKGRVLYVWIKSLHLLAYYISRIFEISNRFELIVNPNGMLIKRFYVKGLGSFCAVWPFIEFISVLPWVVLKVYLPIFFGYTVITDRYLIDTLITVSTRIGDPNLSRRFLGRLMLKLIPKDSVVIQLNADLNTILERRKDIEYTYEEIQEQISLYKLLSRKINAYELDTTDTSSKKNLEKIINLINL